MNNKKKFEDILIDAGIISEEQLTTAREKQKTWGGKLEHTMLQLGYFDEEFLTELLSEHFHIPRISIADKEINEKLIGLFPKNILIEYTFFPVEETEKSFVICIADPSQSDTLEFIKKSLGGKIRFVLDTEKALTKVINHYFNTQLQPKEYTPIETNKEKIFEKTIKSIENAKFDIFQKDNFQDEMNSFLLNALFSLETALRNVSDENNRHNSIKEKLQKLIRLLNKKGFRIPSYENK